jgi:IS1 family transposase
VKQTAVTLYGYGLSLTAVGRLLGSCAQSVMRWVCGYVDQYCTKPEPEPIPIIEIDEMWHYLDRKTNRVWIWKAYDRFNDRLIDWECGNRDEATFRRLFSRLERWHPRLYCTDDYVVYHNVLPVGRHYVGKSLPSRRRGMKACGWSATTAANDTGWLPAVAAPSWCRDPGR